MEKLNPQESTREYVYLGEDKLKSNIGMRALRRGEDSYLAILDAGVNWYEAKTDFDLILESGNVLCFTITPLTGENIMDKTVTLDGETPLYNEITDPCGDDSNTYSDAGNHRYGIWRTV